MSYLRHLCFFAHSGDQHILCCVFALFFFVLYTPMLSVLLDCPYLIAPSVFSNVYIETQSSKPAENES
jgi:accessory gene regulator protein AgrB